MKVISTILFVLGLIAVPGYFFYCTSFSGSELERIAVFSQDVTSLSAGGVTVQSSGANAQWNSPVKLELTPDMNPISVQAIVRYMKPVRAGRHRAEYRFALARDETAVWSKMFSVSAKKETQDKKSVQIGAMKLPKTTVHVTTFSVEEGGQYTLDVRTGDDHDLTVANLDIALRRNVLIASKYVLIAGGIALLLGVAGLVVSGKRRS